MTPPDDELDIDIRTTLDLGRAEHAHAFLALLERHGSDWMPTRFGPYEPLKHSFATEGACVRALLARRSGRCLTRRRRDLQDRATRWGMGMGEVATVVQRDLQSSVTLSSRPDRCRRSELSAYSHTPSLGLLASAIDGHDAIVTRAQCAPFMAAGESQRIYIHVLVRQRR